MILVTNIRYARVIPTVSIVRKKIIKMEGFVVYVCVCGKKTRYGSTKVQCPQLLDGTGEGKKGHLSKPTAIFIKVLCKQKRLQQQRKLPQYCHV